MQKDYPRIFHELIPSVVSRLDPDKVYWPSSPSSGGKPFEDPNGESTGDGHYWDVWHGRAPFTAYRTQFHRFMSEFGFESMPAPETVMSFAEKDDMNMTSYVMECHQKNEGGNGLDSLLHWSDVPIPQGLRLHVLRQPTPSRRKPCATQWSIGGATAGGVWGHCIGSITTAGRSAVRRESTTMADGRRLNTLPDAFTHLLRCPGRWDQSRTPRHQRHDESRENRGWVDVRSLMGLSCARAR